MTDTVGKTAYDLAWLVYQDMLERYPDEFRSPYDHAWFLAQCMRSTTLKLTEEERIKQEALWLDLHPDRQRRDDSAS